MQRSLENYIFTVQFILLQILVQGINWKIVVEDLRKKLQVNMYLMVLNKNGFSEIVGQSESRGVIDEFLTRSMENK